MPRFVKLENVFLDPDSSVPLYKQLSDGIVDLIRSGILRPGDVLPSSRQLCRDMVLGRNTVILAYDILKSQNYTESKTGVGTYIADPHHWLDLETETAASLQEINHPSKDRSLSAYARNFEPFEYDLDTMPPTRAFLLGMPDEGAFPADLFGKYVGRHIRKNSFDTARYGHGGGWPPLKRAIVDHLAVSRGIKCTEKNVVIVASSQSALSMLSTVLSDPGNAALLENPSYMGAKMAFRNAGLDIKPMNVDDKGADIGAALAAHPDAKLAYLTPTSQFPMCATLSMDRRKSLLAHAESSGMWILEDDYDSEFRFSDRPVPSLKSMDTVGSVMLLGSFSKTLLPGYRIGYVVVPDDIANLVNNVVWQTAIEPALPLQAAIADFMSDGHYFRHIRRMRTLYEKRHDRLVTLLNDSPLGNVVTPIEGGMNLPILLNAEYDDQAIAASLDEVGIVARALSALSFGERRYNGLVLGFSCVDETDMSAGVDALLAALRNKV